MLALILGNHKINQVYPFAEKISAPPLFEVTGEYIGDGSVVYGMAMWNLRNNAIYPVGIAAYLRLGYNGTTSDMVDTMQFEIQTESGEWEKLEAMEFGKMYYGPLATCYPLAIKLLKVDIMDRNLQSGDHAGGWVFFDYPKSAAIANPDFEQYSKHVIHPEMLRAGVGIVFRGGSLQWETSVSPYLPVFRVKITDIHNKTTTAPITIASSRWSDQLTVLYVQGPAQNFENMPIEFQRLQ